MPKHNLKDIELDEVSLVDKGANPGAHVVLFKRDDDIDKVATKTEDGKQFHASDYAYVPDAEKSSTWKLRLTDTPGGTPSARIVGAAVAALGPGGFRGQRVQIPSKDMASVKAKVRAAWKKANPKKDSKSMPSVLKFDIGPDDIESLVWEACVASDEQHNMIEKTEEILQIFKAMSFKDMMALRENREAMESLGEKFGALHSSLISIVEDDTVSNKRMAAHESLNEFHESVLNSLKEVTKMTDKKTDLEKKVDDLTTKLEEAEGKIDVLTKRAEDAEAKVEELEKADGDDKGKKEGINKAALSPEVRKALEDGEEAKAQVAKLQDESITKAFIAKAETFKNLPIESEKLGLIMKGISGNIDEELYKDFEKFLTGANEGMSKVFDEIGSGGGEGSALEALNAKAAEIAKADGITLEAAFVKAQDQNPELAKQERDERANRH